MAQRGRPVDSEIRKNLIEILYFVNKGYAYDLYRIYSAIFPKVTMRSIYYHLNKGVTMGIFRINEIKNEPGNYSWGQSAEKIYYSLTDLASPIGNILVKDYVDNHPK
jgi:hypothetical protein